MRLFIIAAALIVMSCMTGPSFAAEPGITLYSSLRYAKALANAFTKATGTRVRVVVARSADVLTHIAEQGHQPHWSLAWFDGATSAVMLDRAGLLAHHLPAPSGLTKHGMAMTSPDGAWVPTGITLAGILVASADPYVASPDQWPTLTGARYHGIIGMNDPQLARSTYPALISLLQENGGWPAGKSYINSLNHDGLHVYAKDADTMAALRSGSIQLAIIKSSVAFGYAKTRDKSLRLVIPKPVYAMPSVIVMAKSLNRKQRREALRFITFINWPAIQKLRMSAGGSDGWYWPVTQHPAPHAGLPPLASLDLRILGARYWGKLEPAIMDWFNKNIVGPRN